MESGEGIERARDLSPAVSTYIVWNPVKILKELSPRFVPLFLKFLWNPVKELKVIDVPRVERFVEHVESGEGIERPSPRSGGSESPRRVESGEGIESPPSTEFITIT